MLAIMYTLTGLGITVAFHRLFTHRSFKTGRTLRALLAMLGSMAVERPVIEWVATHRKHHRFSDHPGHPHSSHLDHAPGWHGVLRGLAHAHVGGMLRGQDMANPARYTKDLLLDRDLVLISRVFPFWVLLRLAIPFGLGVALTGSLAGGLTGLLWGGAVRVFLVHLATFSINSLCHCFGRRAFATSDQSRNLAWLARLVFGEAWHNKPPCVPDVSPSRISPLASRSRCLADHRARALPRRLGRDPDQPYAPTDQAHTRGARLSKHSRR